MLRKIGSRMDGAAVVPHEEIPEFPHMLENELPSLADLIECVEHCCALLGADALDARRHQAVDEQRLAASVRVRDEHRVIVMRDAADVACAVRLPGAIVLMDVERL